MEHDTDNLMRRLSTANKRIETLTLRERTEAAEREVCRLEREANLRELMQEQEQEWTRGESTVTKGERAFYALLAITLYTIPIIAILISLVSSL